MGVKHLTLAGPTSSDLTNVLTFGESGIMAAYDPDDPNKPEYSARYNILRHANGAVTRMVAAEAMERSRGINSEVLLVDEAAAFGNHGLEFYHNLLYGLRLGVSQGVIVTTPKATDLMIELVTAGRDPNSNVRLVTGSTLNNKANLSAQMIANAEKTRHTKFGRAEVDGELILVNEDSAWSPDLLDECRTSKTGEFHPQHWQRIVISVDPAGSSTGKNSDETGIIVGALTETNKVIILKDMTARMSGDAAVQKIHALYDHYEQFCPVKVRTEKNGLGYFFKEMITKHRPFMPVEEYMSVKKKFARALHAASFYETGVVFHDRDADLVDLEEEQVTWGSASNRSPNRIDSLGGCIEGLIGNAHFTKRKKFII